MQIPCPVCHRQLEKKITRKDKPYFTCELCGVQIFVRYQAGIDRLNSDKLGGLPLTDYVICATCEIAVRKSAEKIQKPLLAAEGIYCPQCGSLLMKPQLLQATK
jgi:DNA-directed RNA polymerase subunit RPC12/RpoP